MEASWDEMEAEWGSSSATRPPAAYRRTDLVALLRSADRSVSAFIAEHSDEVEAIRAAAVAPRSSNSSSSSEHPINTAAHSSSFSLLDPQGHAHQRGEKAQRRAADGDSNDSNNDEKLDPDNGNDPDNNSNKDDGNDDTPNVPHYAALYRSLVKVQAPMVRCSRPPFRQLCRRWGATISYSHMMLADSFSRSENCRHAEFGLYTGEDRLVAQLAAKSGPTAAKAARLLYRHCDAFDLNCGCPQRWAMKEGLGSALLEKPELVADMVKCIRNSIEGNDVATTEAASSSSSSPSSSVAPVCVVKMRVYDDMRRSVDFARQMAAAGAGWVTVHGRTPADAPSARVRWESIRLITEDLAKYGVPVVANGGVVDPSSAVLTAVGCGVGSLMSGNGLLDNPAMFYLPEGGQSMLDQLTFGPVFKGSEWCGAGQGQRFPSLEDCVGFYSNLAEMNTKERKRIKTEHTGGNNINGGDEKNTVAAAAAAAAGRGTSPSSEESEARRRQRQRRNLLHGVCPRVPPSLLSPSESSPSALMSSSSMAAFRPLWSLPATPVEAISDFLRASVAMDLATAATVQHSVRMARGYLTPAERVHLSHTRSNGAVASFLCDLGLYVES